jgi:hypothetical protein
MELKELIINTISDGVNEFSFLSRVLLSNQNSETKKMLEEFKNDILLFLTEGKELTGLKNHLSKIINKIIETTEGYQHITKVAGDFLIKIDNYNSIEKKYESSYKSELQESKNIFWFSIGFVIVGLSIVLYSLYGCTLIQIDGNYYLQLFFILYIEGLLVLVLLIRIMFANMEKKKAQQEILNIVHEALDISPIGNRD